MKGGPVPKRVFVQVEANTDHEAHYTVPTGVLFLKATKGDRITSFPLYYSHLKDNHCFDRNNREITIYY